jgi:glycine/D-amino acid oxidase-like deaminating enzyme
MVIVIGGGYWGAAIAHTLRNAGKPVMVLDDQDPMSGSRNAAAIIAPHLYKTDKLRAMLPEGWNDSTIDESVAWATQMGRGVERREGFLNAMLGSTKVTHPSGWGTAFHFGENTLMDLVKPLNEKVQTIRFYGNDWIVQTDARTYTAPKVVVAAGYRTDEVLKMAGLPIIGVKKIYGRGVVGTGTPKYPMPLSVMTRPYTKVGLREWGPGLLYVGATKERNPHESNRTALDALASSVVDNWTLVRRMEGWRPNVNDRFFIKSVAPGLIVATGGNRYGLGVSFAVAQMVKGMLG